MITVNDKNDLTNAIARLNTLAKKSKGLNLKAIIQTWELCLGDLN